MKLKRKTLAKIIAFSLLAAAGGYLIYKKPLDFVKKITGKNQSPALEKVEEISDQGKEKVDKVLGEQVGGISEKVMNSQVVQETKTQVNQIIEQKIVEVKQLPEEELEKIKKEIKKQICEELLKDD